MRRRAFLLGMLCGTLMTAGIAAIAASLVSTGAVPAAAINPAPPPSLPVMLAPPGDAEVPPALPPGWHGYRFNGQMVYVMPLASLSDDGAPLD
jgi:hypothetical protein